MFRRIVAMAMLVSIVAMATSGAMMFVIERPSFTIQMHPVHKLFGLLLIVSAIAHITLNFNGIRAHLRSRSAVMVVSLLTAVLVLLYGVALNNPVPSELATQMDEAARKVESGEKGK